MRRNAIQCHLKDDNDVKDCVKFLRDYSLFVDKIND